MANLISINVLGMAELSKALAELTANVGKNVLRGAVAAGAKIVYDQVKQNASGVSHPLVITGTLQNSVYRKQINELSSEQQQTYFVSLRRGKKEQAKGRDAFYWTWVEFGHHVVPRGKKGATDIKNRRSYAKGQLEAGPVKFVPAYPFLRPGYESSKDKAAAAIIDYLRKRIPLEAQKLGFK